VDNNDDENEKNAARMLAPDDAELVRAALHLAAFIHHGVAGMLKGFADKTVKTPAGQPVGTFRENLTAIVAAARGASKHIKQALGDETAAKLRIGLQDLFKTAKRAKRAGYDRVAEAFMADLSYDLAGLDIQMSQQTSEAVLKILGNFLVADEMPQVPAINATVLILRPFEVSPHAARQDAVERVRERSGNPMWMTRTNPKKTPTSGDVEPDVGELARLLKSLGIKDR